MRAVASGLDVDTEIAVVRMEDEESSSVVLADGSPSCRPPDLGPIGPFRDGRAGLYYARRQRGFQVDQPFFDSLGGCHVGAHGMTLYDGASPAATRVPRGAFNPRRDRSFERTWTQQIALDRGHEPGPPHTFSATGGLTIRLKRISATRGAHTPAQASEYSPNSSRMTPQTSPIEARSFSAARIGSSRFPSPRARLTQLLEPGVDRRPGRGRP